MARENQHILKNKPLPSAHVVLKISDQCREWMLVGGCTLYRIIHWACEDVMDVYKFNQVTYLGPTCHSLKVR